MKGTNKQKFGIFKQFWGQSYKLNPNFHILDLNLIITYPGFTFLLEEEVSLKAFKILKPIFFEIWMQTKLHISGKFMSLLGTLWNFGQKSSWKMSTLATEVTED